MKSPLSILLSLDLDGNKALMVASYYLGRTEESLLAAEADVNAKDDSNHTALHFASDIGHDAVVKLMLAKGANVDAKDNNGDSALHFAGGMGHTAVVDLLLVAEANVHAQNDEGKTARDLAEYGNHHAVIVVLDQHLASPACSQSEEGHSHTNREGEKQWDLSFPAMEKSWRKVEGWLRSNLPELVQEDAMKYCKALVENGFDSTEALGLLGEEELGFMKKGHKMLVLKKLSEGKDDSLVE